MITSAHSKSSNSPAEFNSILQKFYKMTCKIIVSRTVCGIFLIFCRSSYFNFMVMNRFSEPKIQRRINISRPIYFLKISAHRLVGLICTNMLEEFFFFRKKFSSRTWSFFHNCNTTNLDVIFFSTKKIILYSFSRVII